MRNDTEKEKAILRAMEYAVPSGKLELATDLLDLYRNDPLVLEVLHEFYSFLPEAREDWIREIRLMGRQQGIFLLMAITGSGGYLYMVSGEGIEFQGSLEAGYLDRELLDFFGFADLEDFRKGCAAPEIYPLYESLQTEREVCPACHAASGELHELGCPVEICPWCGGQLIHCNCRYEKLGLDTITSLEEIDRFERLLNERGRIPYSPEQRPSFADEGPGVVFE